MSGTFTRFPRSQIRWDSPQWQGERSDDRFAEMHSSEAGDSRVSPARLAGEMEIGFRVSLPEERVLTGNVAGKLSCFRRLLREIGATPSHGLRNDGRKVQVDLS